jgi:hypothetical protein
MKKLNMPRVILTTVLVSAFALGPLLAFGQKAVSESALAPAPIVEHLKIENGEIWTREPGQAMVNTHQASTLGNAIKALQKIYPDDTFAVDPRTMDVSLADVIIRANDAGTDLEALRTASGGKFDFNAKLAQSPATGGAASTLYTIRPNNTTDSNSEAEERVVECFSLTGYIQHAISTTDPKDPSGRKAAPDKALGELQEIITSTILDFDSSIKQPKFRFYSDAQLFIVTGSPRAIDIAAKVISALPGQQGASWDSNWGRNIRNSRLPQQMGVAPGGLQPKPDQAFGVDPSAK